MTLFTVFLLLNLFWELLAEGCGLPGSHLNSKLVFHHPPTDDGANSGVYPISVDTAAIYSCEEPYIVLGDSKRTCLSSLKWSGVAPFCGLNVAMHKPLILPVDSSAWLTIDGIISTRPKDCLSKELSSGEIFTWKLDLIENFQVHGIRILALADSQWSAKVTLQSWDSKYGYGKDIFCGNVESSGSADSVTAAVALACQQILSVRFVQIDFSTVAVGRIRICEINVLAIDALTSDFCPQPASAKSVSNGSCLSFHSHGRTTWSNALQSCRKIGGTLIQDIGGQEKLLIQSKLQYLHRFQPTDAFYWIGLFRSVNISGIQDQWLWTSGVPPSESFWAAGQPDNIGSRQFCAGLAGRMGWLWNDLNCESGTGFWICRTDFTSCPMPEQPTNGMITMLDRRVGGLVHYRCEEGSNMIGSPSRTCLSSGKWSGILTRCTLPHPLINSHHHAKTTPRPSTIQVMATTATPLVTSDTTQLTTAATLSTPLAPITFKFTPVKITPLSLLPDGNLSTRLTVGTALDTRMATNEVFYFTEPSRRTSDLLSDQTTVSTSAKNTQVTEGRVTKYSVTMRNVTDGVTRNDTPLSFKSTFTGFRTSSLVGSRISNSSVPATIVYSWTLPTVDTTSKSVSMFHPILTIVTQMSAPKVTPETFPSTTMTATTTLSTTKVITESSSTSTVTTTLTSSPSTSTTAVTSRYHQLPFFLPDLNSRCKHIPHLLNGKHAIEMLGPTVVARYSCNSGFNLVGIPFLTCTPDGLWRGIMPLCIPGLGGSVATTKAPAVPETATTTSATTPSTISTSSTPSTSTQVFTTPARRSGLNTTSTTSTTMTRTTDMVTTSSGVVAYRSCPPLPIVQYSETLFHKSLVLFRCFPGYLLHGDNFTQCLPEGYWTPVPTCVPLDCDKPEKPAYGTVVLLNGTSTFGSVAAVSCLNYPANAVFYRICTDTGKWEGQVPACSVELPTLVPSESKQEPSKAISGTMTITIAVVATISGLLMLLATLFTVRWVKRRESAPVAISPSVYSLGADHQSQSDVTVERHAFGSVFTRPRYVPSDSVAQFANAYESNGQRSSTRSNVYTQTGRFNSV